MKATIRPYTEIDREPVLAVFHTNVPGFFAEAEAEGLVKTLDHPDGPHWVVERDGDVVGYGGFEVGHAYNRVTLCWGMIAAPHHGRGLGRRLLIQRAAEAVRQSPPETAHLVVDTTPRVAGFYRRHGFEEVSFWPRGYRAGFDMVVLRLAFGSPAMRALIGEAQAETSCY